MSLAFILDDYLTFEKQVNRVCSSRNYQLRRICSVWYACHALVRALAISWLDYLVIDISTDFWINKDDDIISKVLTWFFSVILKQNDDKTELLFVFRRNSFHSIPEIVLFKAISFLYQLK